MMSSRLLMEFGGAIAELQKGNQVARQDWCGAWLILVPGSTPHITPDSPYGQVLGEYADCDGYIDQIHIQPHIDLFTYTDDMQPGWTPTQADMLAEDWIIV